MIEIKNQEDTLVTVSIAFGNEDEAMRVAAALVEQQLVACTQVWPIRSTYRWKGKVEDANEFLLSAKTVATALPALEVYVLSQHSYEVPEIVVQPINWASENYAAWIRECVRPG